MATRRARPGILLLEVAVAVLVVALLLLAAGHATASAIRLGARGVAAAERAAALASQAAALEAAGRRGWPCRRMGPGTEDHGAVVVRWSAAPAGPPAQVRLEASGAGAGRDTITLLLPCR